MSRLDLRWIAHHPFRWLRAVWFHWAIAALLLAKAVMITHPLWDVTAGAHLWPIALGFTAAMCVASSIALSEHRLQVATMLVLMGVATWRAVTYLMVMAAGLGETTTVLAQGFGMHWTLIAVAATRWPTISTRAALIVTVEAGRDSGHLRATG